MQADYYLNQDIWRDDSVTKRMWKKLKKGLDRGRTSLSQLKKLCTKYAINMLSLQSPPNVLRDLQSFDTRKQLAFDEFHNVGEGHANVAYKDVCPLFTPEAEAVIQACWEDPTLWDPSTGRVL